MNPLIYGTAWKKERTESLVTLALKKGFRAIDTANQAKHYNEIGVGAALKRAFDEGVSRSSLFLQTKFTSIDGQDHRLPYDPKAPIREQVMQSFNSSLEHLHTHFLDSYLLHGPYNYPGLGDEDWQVWETLELLKKEKKTRLIGVSNVNARQIKELTVSATQKPDVVQNRCYANQGWDFEVRNFCIENNIQYQGFSLLTANPQILHSQVIREIAKSKNVIPAQVIFRFCEKIGITVLTGTTDPLHMEQDLNTESLVLSNEELKIIGTLL